MIGGDEVLGFPVNPGIALSVPCRDHVHSVLLVVVEEYEVDRQRVLEGLADRHEQVRIEGVRIPTDIYRLEGIDLVLDRLRPGPIFPCQCYQNRFDGWIKIRSGLFRVVAGGKVDDQDDGCYGSENEILDPVRAAPVLREEVTEEVA